MWCCCLCSNFGGDSADCSGEFSVAFEHSEDHKNLILNMLKDLEHL